MRSLLLSPRWLVRHAIAIVLIVVCLRLGWWQWDRARAVGGTAQNLGYALQWPAFGGFVVYAWFRMLRLELHAPSATSPAAPEIDATELAAATDAEATGPAGSAKPPVEVREQSAEGAEAGARPRTVQVRRRYVPPAATAAPAAEPNPDEPSDEALAAYNAYLSSLAGPDEQRTKK